MRSAEDRLSTLPLDAQKHILSYVPVHTLATCERVSRVLNAAATDNGCWMPHCHRYWPSASLSRTVPSYRECFLSDNGWRHVRRLPRACFNDAASSRRHDAPSSSVVAWDASESSIVSVSRSVRNAQRREMTHDITFRCGDEDDGTAAARVSLETPPLRWVQDVKLLALDHVEPRALVLQVAADLAVTHLHMASPGVPVDLASPLWTHAAPFKELHPTADGLGAVLLGCAAPPSHSAVWVHR